MDTCVLNINTSLKTTTRTKQTSMREVIIIFGSVYLDTKGEEVESANSVNLEIKKRCLLIFLILKFRHGLRTTS